MNSWNFQWVPPRFLLYDVSQKANLAIVLRYAMRYATCSVSRIADKSEKKCDTLELWFPKIHWDFLSWDFGIFQKFIFKIYVKIEKIIDFVWDRSISHRFRILLIFISLKSYESQLFIGTKIIKIRKL